VPVITKTGEKNKYCLLHDFHHFAKNASLAFNKHKKRRLNVNIFIKLLNCDTYSAYYGRR